MKAIYRSGVFVVCYRKTKSIFGKPIINYLLLKRKLHWKGWEFPKGGIEKKETIIKTIKREILEETGQEIYNIYNHKVSGRYLYSKEIRGRKGFDGQSYKLFSGEIKNKKISIDNHEHSTYKWVDFKKAIKLLTNTNQKDCLKKVNSYLTNQYKE